jgi:hypothetical protein
LTVAGAQTYSGAARFEVSTDGPALAAIQNGAGAAFQADDILLKITKLIFPVWDRWKLTATAI